MIPIQDVLNRIRWDPEYARADFTIGYYDRVRHTILIVPLRRESLECPNPFFLELANEEGARCSVPLHRIRQVFRDGKLIWERKGPAA